jgi:ubiquinone/menaquinone biosynthesis C-methylase UbiE
MEFETMRISLHRYIAVLILCLITVISIPLNAQDNPQKYEWGDRDERQNPDYVIAAMGLSAGDVIADVGAGGSYFTVRFAKVVGPAGSVIASDINQDYLDFIENRVAEAGFTNVELLLAEMNHPRLPEGKCDYIFLSSVYHHLADPVDYLEKARSALKPGGKLVIVETFRRISSHGSRVEDVVSGMQNAGYSLVTMDESQPRFFIGIFSAQ